MTDTIKKTVKKYNNFKGTYKDAYVGFPKGFGGIKKPYYGTFSEFKKKHPNIKVEKTYATVLYMHGSSGLYRGEVYRKYIVEDLGYIFFAPDSYKIKNRPTYESPAKHSLYEKVHKIRIAEIAYNHKKLKKLDFIDNKNIFLMGNSEGGLAVAIYKEGNFRARIVTAFSCESSYFYKNFKLGCKKSEPFLNIIGTHDEFFSQDSYLTKKYKVNGNGIEKLKNYKNAKVVVLPKAKHDLTQNIYVKDEIVNFLKLWCRE
ncbi:MAG: dienelactone hydrolase family protein [Campylobacterota bacterium]|nr:dienelactone hydrolase family protein [Campylobacterota bacterium]